LDFWDWFGAGARAMVQNCAVRGNREHTTITAPPERELYPAKRWGLVWVRRS
jgi:hypothetical protein